MTRLLACALAVSACTGGPVTSTAATDAAPIVALDAVVGGGDAGPMEDTRPAVVHVVLVTDDGYDPVFVVGHAGDWIEWRWTTRLATSVTSGIPCLADGMFTSGTKVEPASYRVRLPFAGPYLYFDDLSCDTMIGGVLLAP